MTTQLPIPKERLEAIAALRDITLPDGTTITANAYGVAGSHDIALMARFILAAYEQKPVGWTDEQELRDVETDGCGYLFKANPITPHADLRRVIKLYAHPAPSIPAAVPDFKKLAAELVENLVDCDSADDSAISQYTKWAEKTCRAAMLAAAPRGV